MARILTDHVSRSFICLALLLLCLCAVWNLFGAQICTTTSIGPNEFKGISGSSDNNVIAVGKNGDIYQYNGTSWSAMTSGSTEDFEDVEVVDGTTAFAVGKKGTILELSGTTWSSHTGVTAQDLKGVWAASSTEAYVVGKKGTLFSYNGTTWTDQSAAAGTSTGIDLEDAWGDANSFYGLGKNGTLYQFNRGTSTWSAPDTLCNVGVDFKDLWGDGAGNIYLAGKGGAIYMHDGASCTLVATASEDLEGIYGSTATGEIYAVGKKGVVMFFNGVSWQETTEGTQDLKDVWVSSAGNAYYTGKNGQTSTCTFTPTTACTTTIIPGNPDLKGISGSSDTNVIAVGKGGDIQQFNGTTWSAMTSPTTEDLEDVEVVDGTTAFAVGKKGTILELSGTTWSSHTGVTAQDLKGVWAASLTEAYVVGKKGTLFSYNGTTWTDQSAAAGTSTGIDLEDAWGDANSFYGLGKNGTLYQFNRGTSTWSAPDTLCNVGVDFKDLWGDGAGNIYLAGKNGRIYQHNGSTCTLVATASQDLEGIYGSGPNDIYAVGKSGVVMHFDGTSWTETTPGTEDLKDVWVSPAGKPYYAGKNGELTVCEPVTVLAHYAISYPNGTPGLTCEALAVRITAHDNSHAAVSPSNTKTITLSTTPAADSWALKAGNGTFTGPNQYTFDGTETFAEFWLTETTATTAPHIDIDVTDGTVTDIDGDATEDVNAQFVDTAFRITDAAPAAATIGTQIAGKDSDTGFGAQTRFIQAIRTDTNTGACVGIFQSQTATIQMASECNNPTVCEAGSGGPGSTVSVEDNSPAFVAIGVNDNSSGNPAIYANVTLNFDADSKAPLVFRYPDAGQITLHARYDLDPPNLVYMTGASNAFVVRPFGFDVQVTANPGATSPGGAMFTSAGSTFTVTARAVQWQVGDDTNNDGVPDGHQSGDTNPANNANLTDNGSTPNYGQETLATEADVSLIGLLDQPGGGTDPGLSGGTTISTFTAGSGNTATAQYNEVGIIEVRAGVADSNYLGVGQIQGVSGYVGRFTPFDFDVSLNTPVFGTACGTFGYIGQSFVYTINPVMTVTARNASTGTTQNYTGAFFKLTDAKLVLSGNKTYAAAVGTLDMGLIPSPDPVIADTGSGMGTLTFNDGGGIAFNRGAPQDPFAADIGLSLAVIDEDNVVYGGNPAKFGDATAGNGITFDNGKEQRWGRLVLNNAFGSELLPLEIPVWAEYQTGGDFVTNTADNCTPYAAASVTYSNRTGLTVDPTASGSGTLINGQDDPANPLLLTNTLQEVGFVDVTHATDSWLQYDWDGDTNHDNTPTSRATWGIYKGPKEFIYLREPW